MPSISRKPASPKKQGQTLLIYGIEGVGKSTLAAHFPSPYFLFDENERGISRLLNKGLVKVLGSEQFTTYDGLLHRIVNLADKSEIQTIVIEGMLGVERYLYDIACQKSYGSDFDKFFEFYRGPSQATQEWLPGFFNACNYANDQGKTVVITGHAEVREFQNPEGPNYDRYRMVLLYDKLFKNLKAWCGHLLFYTYDVDYVRVDKKQIKGKTASGVTYRILHTQWRPASDAKSIGMPPSILADSPVEAVKVILTSLYS